MPTCLIKQQTTVAPLILVAALASGCTSPGARYSDGNEYRSGAARSNEGYYAVIASIESDSAGAGIAAVRSATGRGSHDRQAGAANAGQDVYLIRVRFDDRTIAGKRDQLTGSVQQAYGITQDQAELQVKAFEAVHKDYQPKVPA